MNPTPNVVSISPASVTAGAGTQTITVTGTGFVQGAVVSFNGAAVPTTYTSSTTLQAQLPASALTGGQVAPVTVANPSSSGGSSAVNFSVNAPTPQVSGIAPQNVPQAQAVTMTITGTGFESNSTVLWNGAAVPTSFVNSTTLTVALTAAQVQDLGNAQITVNNPGPGGTTATPVAVLVYPVPTVTTVTPSSVPAQSGPTEVVVTGTNFVQGSVVQLDATAYPTAYMSATSLKASISATALATSRSANLTVQNPDPQPAISTAFSFTITAPTLSLMSISPSVVTQGASSAQITLTGSGFEPNSLVQFNGSSRPTMWVNPGSLRAILSTADLANAGTAQITVNNPGPGTGTSGPQTLTIVAPPVISSVSPSTIQVSSGSSASPLTVTITGTNFTPNAKAMIGSANLTITSQSSTQIVGTLNTSQIYGTGPVKVYVDNLVATNYYVASLPATVNVINPAAPISVYPAAAAVGSADLKVTVNGGGYFPDSVVQWNGTALATTYSSANSLTAIIPAELLAVPGTATISIATPENQGAAGSTQGFSTYIAMPINDLVWNSHDGLLYATIAGRAGQGLGNSLVGLDPTTGTVQRTIFVGSEPNRLAISDDGTQAFVGLDGAGAVRQVNLQTGTAGVQWWLTQGLAYSSPPYKASSLAVLPGQPNSVAVYSTSGVVTIFDSGVARANSSSGLNTYFASNYGGLAFGSSASTLYLSANGAGSYVYALTVDGTGITGYKQLATSGGGTTLQYDNGRLYFPNGIVADAPSGNTLGQFSVAASYSTTAVAAQGPVVSDSALNRAWVVPDNYGNTTQVIGYDETTFNPASSIAVTGVGSYSTTGVGLGYPADLVRWGQNGLAFHTPDQLYILHGAIVKDTSGSPADLQVSAQVPATVTTGTAFSYQLQVTNSGPNDAQGVLLTTRLPEALIYGSASTSQGSCSGNGVLYCDVGAIKNGASATVTITATPSTQGSIQVNANIDSQSFDPNSSNNETTATATSSGSLYSPVPQVSNLSPNVVAAGAASFTLTVNGSGFTSASTVNWNGTALPTTLVSSGQLTATVDSSLIQQLGWGTVTVSSAGPGGGNSGPLTLSIYSVLKVPANAMTWDPFTRKLYAVLPSTSTSITGNSLVSIDPVTGTTGTPIQVGSEPNLIAETTSGNYLYLGVSGAKSLERFNIATQAVDATVPLTSTAYYPTGPVAATSVTAIPGLEDSVSVGNVGIFDFNGTTATMRPSPILNSGPVFPDAEHAYVGALSRYTVDSSGVHLTDTTGVQGFGGFSQTIALDDGLVYGASGGIVDPRTKIPTQIAVLPYGQGPYQTGLIGGGVVPYAAEQKSFNVGVNAAGTWMLFLQRFDTQHFTLDDTIELPTGNNIVESVAGTRWEQDGLAYVLNSGIGGNNPAQILLLRGPFVSPAEANANAAPTMTSVGSGTIAVGSGNQRITVTGSGFMPGASVLWNGVVHDTTFVDSQHLSVAVGASEVASAASVTVTCQNPGSGNSNAVTVSVQ